MLKIANGYIDDDRVHHFYNQSLTRAGYIPHRRGDVHLQ